MASFHPLHIRMQLLEEMEWEEEMVDEAFDRAVTIFKELLLGGVDPLEAPKQARKKLSEEYDDKVVGLLIDYLVAEATRIQNTGEA